MIDALMMLSGEETLFYMLCLVGGLEIVALFSICVCHIICKLLEF